MPPKYCNLCGRRISSGVVNIYHRWGKASGKGLTVCAKCEHTAPRCRVCGLPTTGDELCAYCQEHLPRCIVCGETITDHYFQHNGRGPFCENCVTNRAPCAVCGNPLGDHNWKLHDGRVICDSCHQTAVYDHHRAAELFNWVTQIIIERLRLSTHIPLVAKLVDRNQLLELVAEKEESPSEPETIFGIYRAEDLNRVVYVEYGLPQILFIQVAAHEYAHAWQRENCPMLNSRLVSEGFSEWVAYKVLQAMGTRKKQAIMLQRADLYGDGLRWMLAVERERGIVGVVAECRAVRDFAT